MLRNQTVGSRCGSFGVRSYVDYLEVHEQGLRVRLGVGHFDDPVAVVIESPCVQQFVLGPRPRPSGVLALELLVRVCDLRVMITPAVPGVTWYGVQVPPVLLNIFAVVALLASKAEGSFLQDRVPPVPERETKAETLLDVAEARQTVLSPSGTPSTGRGRAGSNPMRRRGRCSPLGQCPTAAR